MLKKITLFFFSFLIIVPFAIAAEKTPLSIFTRPGCAFCQKEIAFLDKLKNERDDFEIINLDIYENTETATLFTKIVELENLSQGTPITLVGNTILFGFGGDSTTGQQIRELLDLSKNKPTLTVPEFIEVGGSSQVEPCNIQKQGKCFDVRDHFLVEIPFFGAVDVAKFSLPTMAGVLGLVDGFNPCAMWVLVTFLVVLLQIGDRRKMFEVAGLFIVAEAVMYYLILNIWFTTWDFVGLDRFITPLVGMVAIGGGVFFLWEGLTSDGTCKITNLGQRAKISHQIRLLAAKPMTWAAAGGVLALAFSVNIIEFACSIGIPQAFTKILQINLLSFFYRQILLAIYIVFYIVDDLIIFSIALAGIEKLGITHRYSRISNFIGGVLMLVLGGLLVFAPELLTFG